MIKKELLPRYPWLVSSKGEIELNPLRNLNQSHQYQVWVTLHSLSISCCWRFFSSAISHPSHPPPGQEPFLPAPWMPSPVCQPFYCPAVLSRALYCKIKNVSFIFRACSLYITCVKSILNLLQYYIADCISWVYRLTLLDLRMNWTYEWALDMELICM